MKAKDSELSLINIPEENDEEAKTLNANHTEKKVGFGDKLKKFQAEYSYQDPKQSLTSDTKHEKDSTFEQPSESNETKRSAVPIKLKSKAITKHDLT